MPGGLDLERASSFVILLLSVALVAGIALEELQIYANGTAVGAIAAGLVTLIAGLGVFARLIHRFFRSDDSSTQDAANR